MKYPNGAYLHQPDLAMWHETIRDWPRENLEKLVFDFAYSSGVLSGLELQQASTPNLTLVVKRGRAVYRNQATARAKVIELENDFSLNLSTFIPVSATPSTLLIVAEPLTQTALPTQVIPPAQFLSDGSLNQDYDAAAVVETFNRLTYDSATIQAVGAVTGEMVVLGSVQLSSGQTAVLNSQIKTDHASPRQTAAPNPEITKLREEVAALKTRVEPIGKIGQWAGEINQIPNGYALCDGRELSRVDYPELFSLLTITFGGGNGTTTFNIPDLRDRFVVGAGSTYTRNSKGGANEIALSVAQLPSHDHPVTVDAVADHGHGVTVSNSGNHRHKAI
jgi:hypothetical protein